MRNLFHRFINGQAGVTAIEYRFDRRRHHWRRENCRHRPHDHIHVHRHRFSGRGVILLGSGAFVRRRFFVKSSAPPVWRLEFGRCQTRAFGGQKPGVSIMHTLFHRFIDDQSGVTAIESPSSSSSPCKRSAPTSQPHSRQSAPL
jgi:Flp pilus assembly pilin Flp